MDIKGIKTPKLRREILKLISQASMKTSASRSVYEKNALKFQRPKLLSMYELLTTKPKQITAKTFTQFVEKKKNPAVTRAKKGIKIINKKNQNKYGVKMYKVYGQAFQSKYPNSYYRQSLKYYNNGEEVTSFTVAGELVQAWAYSYLWLNKNRLQSMTNQTVTSGEPYLWFPDAFLMEYPHGYVKYTIEAFDRVGTNVDLMLKKVQSYKNNLQGTCVYDGCVKFMEYKLILNPNNKKAQIALNKLNKSRLQYAKEYTNETLSDIGKLVKSSIVIKDYINGCDQHFNQDKFNDFRIEFMNTKYNHLELTTSSFKEPIVLNTKEELQHIKDVNEYYIEKFGSVYTTDNVYKVKDTEFKNIFKQWSKDVQLPLYSINTSSDGYKFLENYDYVMHRFINKMPIDNSLYQENDLIKSYYNYSNKDYNPFYVGVPSGAFITCSCDETFDYADITKNKLVGFYEVMIISINNNKLTQLGFKVGSKYTLFTSMINILLLHCKLQFINASYGPSVHIPFTEDFLQKEDGLSHYCKAVGIFQRVNTTIDTSVKVINSDVAYYSIINQAGCSYYRDQNIIHISRDNEDVKSYQHIALAIHSYNHTLILNEMLKYNIEDIFGVKLDSIVLKKTVAIQPNKCFKVKEANIEDLLKNWGAIMEAEKAPATILQSVTELETFLTTSVKTNDYFHFNSDLDEGIADPIYEGNECEDDIDITPANWFMPECDILADLGVDLSDIVSDYIKPSNNTTLYVKHILYVLVYITHRVIIIGGKGGSGKTNSLLRNLDPKTTCYTTTCWNLIEGLGKKYGDIIGLSLPKLTGKMDGSNVEKAYRPQIKNIIIDEATLIDIQTIKDIIKMYPHCYIYILGDIDMDGTYYQCSMMNKVINPSKMNCQYVKYTKTYRFNPELDDYLNDLRNKMIEYKGNTRELKKWVEGSLIKSCYKSIDDITYNTDDVGISCNNEMGDKSKHLTEKFIARGAKPKYFIKNTYLHKKQMRGQELFEIPDHKNYEMKLFKTIHSFQGLDLNENNKIIIDLSCVFDYNLIYTAFSRARRIDQIQIII